MVKTTGGKLLFMVLTALLVLVVGVGVASAATVGQQLLSPEPSWQRYDDTNSYITYLGTGWISDSSYTPYGGTRIHSTASTNEIEFYFTGTKLRIIGVTSTNWSNSVQIKIDDTVAGTFSQYGSIVTQVLNFERTGLTSNIHKVEITNLQSGKIFGLDAVDIDDNGILGPYPQAPTDLTATGGDTQVALSWTAVTGASSYKVKRATTGGGPYTDLASDITTTSHIDSTVTNGTTYYYVVTAITDGSESGNSNEASATPLEEVTPPSGNGTLIITVANNADREYNLTMEEIQGFITWYANRSTGGSIYIINMGAAGAYSNIKDYLVFDKIVAWKVMEY